MNISSDLLSANSTKNLPPLLLNGFYSYDFMKKLAGHPVLKVPTPPKIIYEYSYSSLIRSRCQKSPTTFIKWTLLLRFYEKACRSPCFKSARATKSHI